MQIHRIPTAGRIDALQLADAQAPTPGPNQVVVRVHASCLNYRDLSVILGRYGRGGLPENLIPLSDGAGEVVAVGAGVRRVAVGDRVAAAFMQTWLAGGINAEDGASALGGAIDGMLAEQVLLHEDGLVHIPDHLSYEEAATLPCAAVTAWHALAEHARIRPGETVLLQGTGGVSIFALQFARMMGARVIITSSSDAKLARAKEMGADIGINYRTTPDWQDAVRAATGGRGADAVVEVGGPGTFMRSLQSLRIGGKLSLIGVLTGTAEINPTAIMRAQINVQGIYVGSRAMFEDMNRAISAHRMRPVIDRVFPFAEAQAAYAFLQSAAHFGKVVIAHR